MRRILLALALVVAVPAAFANSNRPTTIDTDQPVKDIIEQQQRIRADVTAVRNGWDEISQAQRETLLRQQDQVFIMLEGKQTIADLAPQRQVEVANLLESIKATITGVEDERRICTRERKVGSHFPARVCRTVGQIRREREATRDALHRGDNFKRFSAGGD